MEQYRDNDIENKYKAVFIASSIADTIGFWNGMWDEKYLETDSLDVVYEMIYNFVALGGINGLDMKGLRLSYNSLFLNATAKIMLEINDKYEMTDEYIEDCKDALKIVYRDVNNEYWKKLRRFYRLVTKTFVTISQLTDDVDGRNMPYDIKTNDNDASIRCMCIGLMFDESKINNLIDVALTYSILTHTSAIGFLGGLASAYFVMLAISKVPMEKWGYKLIKLLESKRVKKYIGMDNNQRLQDYTFFIRQWKKYLDMRFENGERIKDKTTENMIVRARLIYDHFTQASLNKYIQDPTSYRRNMAYIGRDSISALIMAYEGLLDCEGKWEKLVFYTILHPGDRAGVGSLAAGFYGAVYGFGDIPEYMLEELELKDEMIELGRKMYSRFFLNS